MKNIQYETLASERAEFISKGACCVRGVFRDWIQTVGRGLTQSMSAPSLLAKTWVGDHGRGMFFQDGFAWNRIEPLQEFVFQSPAARLVGALMGSSRVNLYMDHVLIRDPSTDKATPWHHDTPYCFVDGADFCTIWLPLDPIEIGNGLRLVSGSHTWNKLFLPVEFGSSEAYAQHGGETRSFESVPDIDGSPDRFKILSWALEPGDCVVFFCNMLHSAPPHLASSGMRRVYSTRWTGDDARYALRNWSVPPLPCDPDLKPGDPIGGRLFPRVL